MPIIGKPLRNSDSIRVVRLDVALLERGLTDSRSKAQRLIADGKVSVNGVDVTKASTKVGCDDVITADRGDDYVFQGRIQAGRRVRTIRRRRIAFSAGIALLGYWRVHRRFL